MNNLRQFVLNDGAGRRFLRMNPVCHLMGILLLTIPLAVYAQPRLTPLIQPEFDPLSGGDNLANSAHARYLHTVGDMVVVREINSGDDLWWVTDGTREGTRLRDAQGYFAYYLGRLNEWNVFHGALGDLHLVDDTFTEIRHLGVLPRTHIDVPSRGMVHRGDLYFVYKKKDLDLVELARIDGETLTPTVLEEFSAPFHLGTGKTPWSPIIAHNDRIYFQFNHLYSWTPEDGLLTIHQSLPFSGGEWPQFEVFGDYFYSVANDGLLISDGTPEGTTHVVVDGGGALTGAQEIVRVDDAVYFIGQQESGPLTIYAIEDDPGVATRLATSIELSSMNLMHHLQYWQGSLYFFRGANSEMLRYDLASGSISVIHPPVFLQQSSGQHFQILPRPDRLYFVARTSTTSMGMYYLDHPAGPAVRLGDAAVHGFGFSSQPTRPLIAPLQDSVIAAFQHEGKYGFNRIDTSGEIETLGTIGIQREYAIPANWMEIGGGRVLFTTRNPDDFALWVTEGTADTTTRLLQGSLNVRATATHIESGMAALMVSQNRDGATHFYLWVTDGTSLGTRLLAAFPPDYIESSRLVALFIDDEFVYHIWDGAGVYRTGLDDSETTLFSEHVIHRHIAIPGGWVVELDGGVHLQHTGTSATPDFLNPGVEVLREGGEPLGQVTLAWSGVIANGDVVVGTTLPNRIYFRIVTSGPGAGTARQITMPAGPSSTTIRSVDIENDSMYVVERESIDRFVIHRLEGDDISTREFTTVDLEEGMPMSPDFFYLGEYTDGIVYQLRSSDHAHAYLFINMETGEYVVETDPIDGVVLDPAGFGQATPSRRDAVLPTGGGGIIYSWDPRKKYSEIRYKANPHSNPQSLHLPMMGESPPLRMNLVPQFVQLHSLYSSETGIVYLGLYHPKTGVQPYAIHDISTLAGFMMF